MITAADELLIREKLTNDIASSTGYRVIPAPIYFRDKSDYFGTDEDVADNAKDTQSELELEPIKAAWLYLKGFEDSDEGNSDSPLVFLNYEIVLFQEYYLEREDETATPDAFDKKLLLNHNEFIAAILNLKGTFQGERNLGVLSTQDYVSQRTNSITVLEEIQNMSECEFIPKVLGHKITFRERVDVQLKEC